MFGGFPGRVEIEFILWALSGTRLEWPAILGRRSGVRNHTIELLWRLEGPVLDSLSRGDNPGPRLDEGPCCLARTNRDQQLYHGSDARRCDGRSFLHPVSGTSKEGSCALVGEFISAPVPDWGAASSRWVAGGKEQASWALLSLLASGFA
jgi:hypothetical protein